MLLMHADPHPRFASLIIFSLLIVLRRIQFFPDFLLQFLHTVPPSSPPLRMLLDELLRPFIRLPTNDGKIVKLSRPESGTSTDD